MLKVFTLACLLATGSVFADDGPHVEPGPELKLSDDSAEITRILLNNQLTKCLSKFRKTGDYSIGSVTRQNMNHDVTVYRVHANLLLGGDVVNGNAAMVITERMVDATFGFGKVPVYECDVTSSTFNQ